jgi:FtsP/CotA-like multicopper oxidase with cupredoxin domain
MSLWPHAERNRSHGPQLRLSEQMVGHEMVFLINGAAHPDVPILRPSLGATETWTIVNESDMDHPFHMHGFFFVANGARERKDTINIPGNATVTLTPHFDDRDGAAGAWMYHCHILGHAEGGMMGELEAE